MSDPDAKLREAVLQLDAGVIELKPVVEEFMRQYGVRLEK
jgi:hypothetical protein